MSSFISQGSGNVATIVANNVMMNVGGAQLITSIGIFAIIQNFVFMPAVLILGNTIGPLGCWIAYALADLLSGIISRVYMLREIAKLKSVNEVII